MKLHWASWRLLFAALLCGGLAVYSATPASAQTTHHHSNAVLDMVQPELKFENVSLADAIDYIRDTSNANVIVDWKSLEAVNVDRDAEINLHVRNVTLRKALSLILDEAAPGVLTFYMEDNVIQITTQAQADAVLVTMVYPVQDLLIQIPTFMASDASSVTSSISSGGGSQQLGGSAGGATSIGNNSGGNIGNIGNTSTNTKTQAEAGADLVALIKNIVRPEVWRENGGTSSIEFYNGNLIVTAPRSVQEEIGGPLE